MTDLAAWLLEQIAEDERVTDGADWEWLGPWELEKNHALGPGDAMYYAMATPRRTKAECDAKRRILAVHNTWNRVYPGDYDHGPRCVGCGFDGVEEVVTEHVDDCPVLRALALPYADRPGYREEWRP